MVASIALPHWRKDMADDKAHINITCTINRDKNDADMAIDIDASNYDMAKFLRVVREKFGAERPDAVPLLLAGLAVDLADQMRKLPTMAASHVLGVTTLLLKMHYTKGGTPKDLTPEQNAKMTEIAKGLFDNAPLAFPTGNDVLYGLAEIIRLAQQEPTEGADAEGDDVADTRAAQEVNEILRSIMRSKGGREI
jgi:hypothetical protein